MKMLKMFLCILCLTTVSACTTKMGGFIDNSKFVYPNSNVTSMGHTSAKKTKFSVLIPPSWSKSDIDEMFAQALSRTPGADLLINYKSDTTTTFPLLPVVYWSTVEIEGTAAKMVIGKKELK